MSQADPLMWEDPEAFEDPPEPHDDEDFYATDNPEGEETMTEKEAWVRGLREMADAIEKSEIEEPHHFWGGLTLNLFSYDTEGLETLSRQLGGFREKIMEDYYAVHRRKFGPHKIDINLTRDKVCTKVQVGEREVPAREATVEPVFEWVCEDESWVPAA